MMNDLSKKQLSKIKIKGFKSIEECELEIMPLNVFIGCNGAGKSNFINFFQMVRQMLAENLQSYVSKQGGPDALLYFGRKKTRQLQAEISFNNYGYRFALEPTLDNRMMFTNESFSNASGSHCIAKGYFESQAYKEAKTPIEPLILSEIKKWRAYHFHDTSDTSLIKQLHGINDNMYLRADASNLAAFLYLLKSRYEMYYQRIVKTVRLVAPFFKDFHLRPSTHNENFIELEWIENEEDIPYKAHRLSDGTLRFICLATIFLQPEEMQPETIFVDEPELGLHPFAMVLLASLINSVSKSKQVIVSTQSVVFLNEFDIKDVIVIDRKKHQSTFNRLDEEELSSWIEDYNLGELWQKNILGGRPAR